MLVLLCDFVYTPYRQGLFVFCVLFIVLVV